jgi:hypothetical protein
MKINFYLDKPQSEKTILVIADGKVASVSKAGETITFAYDLQRRQGT